MRTCCALLIIATSIEVFADHGAQTWENAHRSVVSVLPTWPGFQKVARKYWKTGMGEYYRSFSKPAFTKALQALVPGVQESDLEPAGAGVRAQACDKDGGLIDDFAIQESDCMVHVLNAPSPAATSSLSIGLEVAERVLKKL